jgi:hypothetical protein
MTPDAKFILALTAAAVVAFVLRGADGDATALRFGLQNSPTALVSGKFGGQAWSHRTR